MVGPVARLHPKIKGVTGSQAAGASIVSFNASAYESYGKSQSFNAPVSEEAAFQYGAALNSLLTGPRSQKHRIRIGDTTTVFWTEKPTLIEDLFADLFSGGSQAVEEIQDVTRRVQIQQLLEAVRSGGRYVEQGNRRPHFTFSVWRQMRPVFPSDSSTALRFRNSSRSYTTTTRA